MTKNQNLEDLLTFLEKNLKKVSTELEEAPTGTLVRVTDRGKVKYLKSDKVDDVYRRKHVDPDADIVKALARKEYLRIEKEILESDIALIRNIKTRYVEPAPENILNRVKKAYDKLPEKYFFMPLSRFSSSGERENKELLFQEQLIEWSRAEYEQSDYKPEKKIHITSEGVRVRSKSELIIAELLYIQDIPFRYEEMLTIANRKFAPDFTILREDGALVYWEHCGMPNNPAYMASHKDKLSKYEAAGIVPWKNLIITYDEPDGTLNIGIIESEIQNKIKRI